MSENNGNVAKVQKSNLKEGMVIACNLYDEDGNLLIPKNTIITPKVLQIIKTVHLSTKKKITVEDYSQPQAPLSGSGQAQFDEKLKVFETERKVVVEDLKGGLNKIVEKNFTDDDFAKTVSAAAQFSSTAGNNLTLFTMLSHLRDNSDDTYMHCLNVGMIASMIGKWVGKSEEECHLLLECGLFHDIGKLVTPDAILKKPGKLTSEEFAIMKQHTTKGYDLLCKLNIDERIKLAALQHHEKCDGSGYPFRLTCDKIHDFSQIITIADIYDALTAKRVYRDSVCPFKVIEIFEQDGFQLYNTVYLTTFLSKVVNSYINEAVVLNNGDEGKVVMLNNSCLSKPVILMGDHFIDLSQNENLKIDQIINKE